MEERSVTLGNYITADHGWTLTGFVLGDPEQKTNYVDKPGGDGSWDLSTVLTDGIPRYKDRPLAITLECSEGSRDEREELINAMVNELDGLVWPVVPPDRPDHYLISRLHVAVKQNSLAYAEVVVSGTCEPWLYSARETVVEIQEISTLPRTVRLFNNGRMLVNPTIVVGGAGLVNLRYGDASISLNGVGSYEWPALLLPPGIHELTYLGHSDTTLSIIYREAVLR